MTRLSDVREEPEAISQWDVPIMMAKVSGMMTAYLLILAAMLSFIEPEGLSWTLATAGAGMGVGTLALLLVKRVGQRRLTTVFDRNDDSQMR